MNGFLFLNAAQEIIPVKRRNKKYFFILVDLWLIIPLRYRE
jgi:hypothetical protein